MSTYAVGDIHGCLKSLKHLLYHIKFNENQDHLWFTGDLINRGPKSLETLRFIHEMKDIAKIVLGNHDITLLINSHNYYLPYIKYDTPFQEIIRAYDKNTIINWLKKQPLFYHDDNLNFSMVHAGILPSWDKKACIFLNKEVQDYLNNKEKYKVLINNLFCNKPDVWDENMQGIRRIRFIINVFTRLRFCTSYGEIELKTKGCKIKNYKKYKPWFSFNSKYRKEKIIFGHWASLMGKVKEKNVYPLDTGCVWDGYLTALRLEDKKLFYIPSKENI